MKDFFTYIRENISFFDDPEEALIRLESAERIHAIDMKFLNIYKENAMHVIAQDQTQKLFDLCFHK